MYLSAYDRSGANLLGSEGVWTLTLDVLSKDGFFESDPDLVSGVVEEIGESDLLSLLVGIAVSEGGTKRVCCAGEDERARWEGARAIDRSLRNEACLSLLFV